MSDTTGKNCPPLSQQPKKVVLDPDGDLSFLVGHNQPEASWGLMTEEPIIFVVCSRTVSRASPVWKTLVYGVFAESKRPNTSNSSEWLIELPEDNPKAMSTILNIIHSRFENLPRISDSINVVDLYHLTVLTDKYDLTTVLRPWATSWMQSLHDSNDYGANPPSHASANLRRHLWIAWELGDLDHLRKAAKEMILTDTGDISRSKPGDITSNLTSHILDIPGLEDMVRKERLRGIKSLLKPFKDLIDRLLQQPDTPGHKTVCSTIDYFGSSKNCDAAMLGVVIRSLSWAGLWPIPETSLFLGSMRDLATKLKFLDTKSCFPNHSFQPMRDLNAQIDKQISDLEVQLAESQLRHIENQAKKSGLSL
ncbi:hypothetical protein F5X96DRAFT_652594 [Biscogniauxia mediterranea]|nr:hypothetical protein F5X96DRAFT_652594 [Biscogniauxia mediterranea]